MSLTLGTHVYTQDRTFPDSVKHVSASNDFSNEDSLTLSRSYPKRTATSNGNARPAVKLVETVTVGTEKLDLIYNGALQVPVGVPSANVSAFVDRIAAFWATAEADNLANKLDITV